MMSVVFAGGNGMTILMGLLGKPCEFAVEKKRAHKVRIRNLILPPE
jgi:hypothetical protein